MTYIYVASSWRNAMQPAVIETLRAADLDCYDFRNPNEGSDGFSWPEVKSSDGPASIAACAHCGEQIACSSFAALGFYEPDVDPTSDPVIWRHLRTGYAACHIGASSAAIPRKGSDLETAEEYLRMLSHPRAVDGFATDFAAMEKADTFVMLLPCGKSAHLELGWAVGAGKRTAILLEDLVEPELMYRIVDFITVSLHDLLGWLGVED
jgi:hypothetical protein